MADPSAAVTTAVTILSLLEKTGSWGAGSFLIAFFLIPPLLGFFAARTVARVIRSLEQRIVESDQKTERLFKAVAAKYDNNVILVEEYARLVKNHQALSDALIETIKENTKVQSKLVERIGAVIGR